MVDVVVAFNILFALFLVFLNGFFVATEFALVKVRPTRLEMLAEKGTAGAKLAREAVDNLDDYLAACQLGITIASLGLGWIGEPAVAALIEPILGDVLPEGSVHVAAVAIGFSFITFLHVVFGELAPKTLSIRDAERISLLVSPPMKVIYYLFLPGIMVFNGTANFFTRLLGYPPASEVDETHTEEDILRLVAQSSEQGIVKESQQEMIEGVFELQETIAREIMVPRPDVQILEADSTVEEILGIAAQKSHTSYPVLDFDGDEEIVGAIHVEDLLGAIRDGQRVTAHELSREVLIVPETRRISELLTEFQDEQIQMAVVIDEWGAFEGIVTMEDVLEEIVGEIRDEFDVAGQEPSISRRDGDVYTIDGGAPLKMVNERLATEFESEDVDTVGGLVLSRLGHAPEVGDRVVVDEYALDVEAVEGTRISTIVARPIDSEESSESETDGTVDSDPAE